MSAETESPFVDLFNVEFDRTTLTVIAMISLDVIWWFLMFDGHVPMPGMSWLMEQGIPMTAPGAMELAVSQTGTLSAYASYFLMWGVMMWAMMYPAMTRYTRDYVNALQGRTVPIVASFVAFLVGYSLTWMASAIIPFSFHVVLPGGIYGFTAAHTHLTIGGILAVTGVYQLTSFRQKRLRDCCARVTPQNAHAPTALKKGVFHGVNCILVCLGLFFLVMPFFGAMNPVWMIGLVLPIALERVPTWGEEIGDAIGFVCFAAGLYVLIAQPALPIGF